MTRFWNKPNENVLVKIIIKGSEILLVLYLSNIAQLPTREIATAERMQTQRIKNNKAIFKLPWIALTSNIFI